MPRPVILTLLAIFISQSLAKAEDTFTADFPIKSPLVNLPQALSEAPQQVITPEGSGYIEFVISPSEEDLFATIIHQEDGEKGAAVYWINEATQQQTMLSADISDGISGLNQRTIHIPKDLLSQPGRFIVQGDQSKILRVRLDWVALRNIFATSDQRPITFLTADRLLQNTELIGNKPLSPPDAWLGRVFEASLQEEPESLDGGLEFVVELEKPVAKAVFAVKVLGLPLDQSLEVWVNDRQIGRLQPSIPALTDAGHLQDASGSDTYAGWRNGAIYVNAKDLTAGKNTIMLVAPQNDVFIRDATLQLRGLASESKTDQPPDNNPTLTP